MKNVQLLLLTAPVDPARAGVVLRKLEKAVAGLRLRQITALPSKNADTLTSRQREVLRGIAVGGCMKELAVRLGISVKTVETHRSRITQRLGTRRIAELVRYAIQSGVIPATWLGER